MCCRPDELKEFRVRERFPVPENLRGHSQRMPLAGPEQHVSHRIGDRLRKRLTPIVLVDLSSYWNTPSIDLKMRWSRQRSVLFAIIAADPAPCTSSSRPWFNKGYRADGRRLAIPVGLDMQTLCDRPLC